MTNGKNHNVKSIYNILTYTYYINRYTYQFIKISRYNYYDILFVRLIKLNKSTQKINCTRYQFEFNFFVYFSNIHKSIKRIEKAYVCL